MYREIEDTLTRELNEVAQGIDVPALPELPRHQPSRDRWQPLLIAAAFVVIVLATVGTLMSLDGDRTIQPAPAPSPTEATDQLSTAAPEAPYVLGDRLYVDGEQVPGSWYFVDGVATGWVAGRVDGSYWWGFDAEPRRIEGPMNQPPAISLDGSLVARIEGTSGQGQLLAFDTDPTGEGTAGPRIPVLDTSGVYTTVAAVTDDGLVITRGGGTSYVWRALVDNELVDLADSAPGQTVLGATPAGLVVVDVATDPAQDSAYLGEISEDGTITRGQDLPPHDELVASEQWLAWIAPGTLGGETGTAAELQVSRLDGDDPGVLTPPDGWTFRGSSVAWESDDRLVAAVTGQEGDRMVRCSPVTEECVLLDTP